VASAASGRNTGFVLPGFGADPGPIIERVGLEHAKSLWALSEAGAEYVRHAIHETGMPGAGLAETGWLHVSKRDDGPELEAYADLVAREFGAAVEYWPADRVRQALQSPLYFGGVQHRRAFSIHPLNYAFGLAAAAEAAGARIFEQTPAIEIDPAGVRKRIVTPQARLRAGHVVLAADIGLGRLMPQLAKTLIPISTYVITTPPLGPALAESIRYPGAITDTEFVNNHYRVVDGDRLMWLGRATVWRGAPHRYVRRLIADIRRAYPKLRDIRAEHAWTCAAGLTVHHMPQIGEHSPGVWVLGGFDGHGLNTTAMGGELVARGIVEGDSTWRLFAPFELVWAGGALGRVATQAYAWWYGGQERVESWLARRQEATRAGRDVTAVAAETMPTQTKDATPAAVPLQADSAPQPEAPKPTPPVPEPAADAPPESSAAAKPRRRKRKGSRAAPEPAEAAPSAANKR
jgi:glycine/D-amino acid oxidase-like deaminating enzyme